MDNLLQGFGWAVVMVVTVIMVGSVWIVINDIISFFRNRNQKQEVEGNKIMKLFYRVLAVSSVVIGIALMYNSILALSQGNELWGIIGLIVAVFAPIFNFFCLKNSKLI